MAWQRALICGSCLCVSSPAATPPCPHRRVLEDPRENPMVRHEAAEALGAIAEPECLELLKQVGVGPRPGCFT